MNIGDQVRYIPGNIHAFSRGPGGEYPWVIGKKVFRPAANGRLLEEIVELNESELLQCLDEIRRNPNPPRNLVLLRPKASWPATVRGVREDSVDLDISIGAFTLHYDRVPIDSAGKLAHSCHLAE
jgi:hypothetical protein